MSDYDLELGLPLPESLSWKDNQEEEEPSKSSWHPVESTYQEGFDSQPLYAHTNHSITGTPYAVESEAKVDEAQDEYIAGVPRKKVEHLMKLWIEVLQGSLTDKRESDSRRATANPLEAEHCQNRDLKSLTHLLSISRPQPGKANVRWLQNGKRNRGIAQDVEVWSESDIRTEDERRRAIRQEWRTSEDNHCLEDCWKHLWQPKSGVDKGLFQWSCSDARRQSLQLRLADALNANSSIIVVGLYMQRDFRAIAPWISQIGLRLNELYRTIYQGASLSPMAQIEILIECIWCCNSFRTELGDKQNNQSPRIGDVLSACYRRRILEAPNQNPLLDYIILREHYQHVRTAIYLISLLYKYQLLKIHRLEDLEETW